MKYEYYRCRGKNYFLRLTDFALKRRIALILNKLKGGREMNYSVQWLRGSKKGCMETILIALVLIIGAYANASAAEKTTDQLLDEARAAVKSVSVQDVKSVVDRKDDKTLLLDIRDMKEYIVDHIHGAQNMSRAVGLSPRILEHHMQKIAPDKAARIIVYCEFETKAPLATKALNDIGYSSAVYMKGGLKAWKDAGYPLVKK
jgi:rhodanese-related sulfurtransferase